MKVVLDAKARVRIGAGLLVAVVVLVLLVLVIREKAQLRSAQGQHDELTALSQRYAEAREIADRVEKRIGLSKAESLPVVVENLVAGMGLKDKLKSVKPFGGGAKEGYDIQEAEASLEKLTMNELVNVLHAFGTAPYGLLVSAADLKRDFANRTLVNARLTLKLVGLKEEQKK